MSTTVLQKMASIWYRSGFLISSTCAVLFSFSWNTYSSLPDRVFCRSWWAVCLSHFFYQVQVSYLLTCKSFSPYVVGPPNHYNIQLTSSFLMKDVTDLVVHFSPRHHDPLLACTFTLSQLQLVSMRPITLILHLCHTFKNIIS